MNFQTAVTQYKQRINNVLACQLEASEIADTRLKQAMEYSLLLGGKRLRPFLVFATGEMFNVPLSELDAPAAALEMIHSYSLIHDDLPAMDDDDLRRGHITNHKKFDEATAILAGDTLQTLAFNLISRYPFQQVSASQQIKMITLLSQCSIDMCAGQSIDLQQTDNLTDDKLNPVEQLQNMHKLKTGALIRASVLMGAYAGNATEQEIESLTCYADSIGLAFQVWDDVLDIISDTETLGKPQGSDLDANKMTYPALLGLDNAKQQAENLIKQAIQALDALPYNTQLLKKLAAYIIERDH